jgi:hypothetical protein
MAVVLEQIGIAFLEYGSKGARCMSRLSHLLYWL